jgi:hypothetical protein
MHFQRKNILKNNCNYVKGKINCNYILKHPNLNHLLSSLCEGEKNIEDYKYNGVSVMLI